jgi:hypothetical protein
MKVKASEFEQHPAGLWDAICVDIIERYGVSSFDGKKKVDKIMFVFETASVDDQGRPMQIDREMTAYPDMPPNSALRAFLGGWRGKALEAGEPIDTDIFLGKCAKLQVVQKNKQDGSAKSVIESIGRPAVRMTASGNYDGDKKREILAKWDAGATFAPAPGKPKITAEDVPPPVKPAPVPVTPIPEEDDVPF